MLGMVFRRPRYMYRKGIFSDASEPGLYASIWCSVGLDILYIKQLVNSVVDVPFSLNLLNQSRSNFYHRQLLRPPFYTGRVVCFIKAHINIAFVF